MKLNSICFNVEKPKIVKARNDNYNSSMCFSIQVDRDIKKLAKTFHAKINEKSFKEFIKRREQNPKSFKSPDENNRIYPNYYAPVIIGDENKKRILTPMRYQLLPHFCEEPKYTRVNPKTGRKVQVKTYNARLDALEKRHAWKGILETNHAIVPFTKFYEYIPSITSRGTNNEKFEVAAFLPKNKEIMWSAALWDRWQGEVDGQETIIDSFAIITDEPPIEVREAGHDRCPIFLQENLIDEWLGSVEKSRIYELLKCKEKTNYRYEYLSAN